MKKAFTILLTTTCTILLILCGVSFFNVQELNERIDETDNKYTLLIDEKNNNDKTLDELSNSLEELENKYSDNKIIELESWKKTVQKVEYLLEH